MFDKFKCAKPGCNMAPLSLIIDGKKQSFGGYCLRHTVDQEKVTEDFYKYIMENDKIVGLNVAGITFDGMEKFDLTEKRFYGCNFQHCIFSGIHSRHLRSRMCSFDFCMFMDCNLLESNMQFTSFAGAKFSHVLFTGSDMIQNNFCGLSSYQSSFDNSDLYNSRFIKANLVDTSIRNCNIKKTLFNACLYNNVSFRLSNTNEAIYDLADKEIFMNKDDEPLGIKK